MRVYARFMAGECYCSALRTVAHKVTSLYDAALEPTGVNVAQFSLLRTVDRAGPVSLTELGQLASLDRSTIGRNIKLLQRMGLVRMAPGADQREATVTLDEPGRDVLRRGAPLWDEAQRKIEEKLGSATATQLRTLLRSL
jgi:DNA-binding MarR family transcriptional regulator